VSPPAVLLCLHSHRYILLSRRSAFTRLPPGFPSSGDHAYYAAVKDGGGGKRATLSEARKIIRQACHILTELGDDALTAA
jgi:hypothetical protein